MYLVPALGHKKLDAIKSEHVQHLKSRLNTKAAEEGVHILRHSFCSHLAMRGAPMKAIQELAGHGDLSVKQRYMHLSSTVLASAIRLMDQSAKVLGDILEMEQGQEGTANE